MFISKQLSTFCTLLPNWCIMASCRSAELCKIIGRNMHYVTCVHACVWEKNKHARDHISIKETKTTFKAKISLDIIAAN